VRDRDYVVILCLSLLILALPGPLPQGSDTSLLLTPTDSMQRGAPVGASLDRYEAIMASIVLLNTPACQGSGVAIARESGITYILTAKHVIEGYVLNDDFNYVLSYNGRGVKILPFRLVAKHKDYDVAIVAVKADLPTLPFGKVPEVRDTVLAAGCPDGAFPPVFTIGTVVVPVDRDHTKHSAGSWFGGSGGPLLDFKTLSVIGINVRIDTVEMPTYQSNRVEAIRIGVLRAFLEEQLLTYKTL